MHKQHSLYRAVLGIVALLFLLSASWAHVSQGQGTPMDQETRRFLENRIQEPGGFDHLPPDDGGVSKTVSPQSLHLWQIETIDESGGQSPSLALDPVGRPHISYYQTYFEKLLKYAYHDGIAWHIEVVDGDLGYETSTSLALDPAGQPHIAYYDFEKRDLKYAHRDHLGWHTEVVDGAGRVGQNPSLAVDMAGHPHVSYYDQDNGNLKYAYYDGASWHIELVKSEGDAGYHSSLVLDEMGNPHLSYFHSTSGQIKYAWHDGQAWHIEWTEMEGKENSLALDSAGHPHIAITSGGQKLKHLYHDGSAWQSQDVDAREGLSGAFHTPSLALDASDHPHISYLGEEAGGDGLKYAYWNGSAWKKGFVDSGGSGSLAMNSEGQIYLTYHAQTLSGANVGLNYAVYQSHLSDWSKLVIASYRDMNWEVYAAGGEGSNPYRLTFNSEVDSTPELDRGGTRIVFRSNRDGNYEIYTVGINGSNLTRLTETAEPEYQPTWSPDGSQIAFYSYRDGNAEIYVMDADGSAQNRLTFDPAWDGHPTWSPDGSQIAFASERNGPSDLWTMNADGSNQQQLTFGLTYASYPDWAPDGNQLAFSEDYDENGWLNLAIVSLDGGDVVHFPGANYPIDHLAPVWSPNGQSLAFAEVHWVEYYGNWYWIYAYVYGLDLRTRLTYSLFDSGYDWWPDWQPTVLAAPTSWVQPLPDWSDEAFTVQWTGAVNGPTPLYSYDIQYRDGPEGIWADWLRNTTQTESVFSGESGHTYYFRSRARDYAGNVEPYPPGDGDALTHVYGHTLSGQILGNRDQAVALARIETLPAALNTAVSGPDGDFELLFDQSGIYDLSASHPRFDTLPPLKSVPVGDGAYPIRLYLPPADDHISDGDFEAEDLVAWTLSGEFTPVLTSTAHTGDFAVQFGGQASALAQEIALTFVPYTGTLSLLYRPESATPLSDSLKAIWSGPTQTVGFTLPLTSTGWTHWWHDVPSWSAPTATLQLLWESNSNDQSTVFVDEITFGTASPGACPVYLPTVVRLGP